MDEVINYYTFLVMTTKEEISLRVYYSMREADTEMNFRGETVKF